MAQVSGKYPDYQHPLNENSFHLDADKPFNPFGWAPPIHREGYVGSKKVKFTQTDHGTYSNNCFDWHDFPSELDHVKSNIVKAIDDAMRVMDYMNVSFRHQFH